MWIYNRMLQFPVDIKVRNPRLAKVIISQYGGPDGDLAASLRYLSQRFGMPDNKSKAILNDVGTEELRTFGNGWKLGSSINRRTFRRRDKKRWF